MNLSDYFFVRCFETANYRESFNDGTNIYRSDTVAFFAFLMDYP